jgi:multidrug efflux pump subunit AcrB
MPNTNYNTLSFTDIVFEHRNKSYGAYELRNSYNKTMGKALVRAVMIFALLFAIPIGIDKLVSYFLPATDSGSIIIPPIELDNVLKPTQAIEPVKPAPKQSGGKTVKSGQIIIAENGPIKFIIGENDINNDNIQFKKSAYYPVTSNGSE